METKWTQDKILKLTYEESCNLSKKDRDNIKATYTRKYKYDRLLISQIQRIRKIKGNDITHLIMNIPLVFFKRNESKYFLKLNNFNRKRLVFLDNQKDYDGIIPLL